MGKIQVSTDGLSAAGTHVTGFASELLGGRGVGSSAAASAAAAAAHPDAQAAIADYWERTQSKLGMTYALINALGDALNQSGTLLYPVADRRGAEALDSTLFHHGPAR
jgi:hypothetical protein